MAVITSMPLYGYSVLIDLSMHRFETPETGVQWFDDSTAGNYDIRKLSAKWVVPFSEADAIFEATYGAGADIPELTFSMGAGFFPFGPDKGSADSTAQCLDIDISSPLESPYKYHEVSGEFIYRSSAAYTLPAPSIQGLFSIGDTTGLYMPQEHFDAYQDRGDAPAITRSGAVKTAGIGYRGNHIISRFTVSGSQANIGALVKNLTQSIRGNSFAIGGYNPFSPIDYNACRLYHNQIKVIHHEHDRFSLSMEVIRQGVPV
jgi:hypothetical protein